MLKLFEPENECKTGVCLFIQQIFIEYLLCARRCSGYQGVNSAHETFIASLTVLVIGWYPQA